jgi:hypothetical protein
LTCFRSNPETRRIRTDGWKSINLTGPERKRFPDEKVREIGEPPTVHLLKGISLMGETRKGSDSRKEDFPSRLKSRDRDGSQQEKPPSGSITRTEVIP